MQHRACESFNAALPAADDVPLHHHHIFHNPTMLHCSPNKAPLKRRSCNAMAGPSQPSSQPRRSTIATSELQCHGRPVAVAITAPELQHHGRRSWPSSQCRRRSAAPAVARDAMRAAMRGGSIAAHRKHTTPSRVVSRQVSSARTLHYS